MPEYEQAVKELPIEKLLSFIPAEGIPTPRLIEILEAQSVSRRTIVRLIQSQLDAGTIAFDSDLAIVPVRQTAAA